MLLLLSALTPMLRYVAAAIVDICDIVTPLLMPLRC